MRKSHYTEEQIAFALRQAEQGTPVTEVIRKMGSASRRFIGGRSDTAVWEPVSCAGSSSWKRRTGG